MGKEKGKIMRKKESDFRRNKKTVIALG